MNSFSAIRTLTFKKDTQTPGGIIMVASSADQKAVVRVKLEAESEDYEHLQLVADVLTAVLSDADNFKGGPNGGQ